jgi:hypothetical protein
MRIAGNQCEQPGPATYLRVSVAPGPVSAADRHHKKSGFHNENVKRRLERQGVQTSPGKVTWLQDAADGRGVPIIGCGSGAIRGTQPEQHVCR